MQKHAGHGLFRKKGVNERVLEIMFLGAALSLAVLSTNALGTEKCSGYDIANGPFLYTTPNTAEVTFQENDNSNVITGFTVTAPSVDPTHQTDYVDVFPGEGQLECTTTAYARIRYPPIWFIAGNCLTLLVQSIGGAGDGG